MEEGKYKYWLSVSILFLIFYVISICIYFGFFNEPTVYPHVVFIDGYATTTYEKIYDGNTLDVFVGAAFACIIFSIIFTNMYRDIKLNKSKVITEKVTIVDKEVSVTMGLISKGGGGQIRKALVVKFRFADGIERDLIVDDDHYISSSNGDMVLLSYKNYFEEYSFIDFVRISYEENL
jgi:hypothetical protein